MLSSVERVDKRFLLVNRIVLNIQNYSHAECTRRNIVFVSIVFLLTLSHKPYINACVVSRVQRDHFVLIRKNEDCLIIVSMVDVKNNSI